MSIMSLVIFLLLIFSAGYAYFTSTLSMNTSNYQISLPQRTSLVCTKTDCNVNVTPAMMSEGNVSDVAKTSSTCYVNCTCSGSPGGICNYNVKLFETGDQYIPSTGLDTNKEFTVNITHPEWCEEINSSSTEPQIDIMVNEVVSRCTIVVPDGGSITASLAAEFKYYNLSLDQTNHANHSFEYQLSAISVNRVAIYQHNSHLEVFIGDNISVLSGDYRLNSTAAFLSQCFIRHIVEDNIIIESDACMGYGENGEWKEACIRGGDPSYFGVYDSTGAESTGNIKILQNLKDYFQNTLGGTCRSSDSKYYCSAKSVFTLSAFSNGRVGCQDINRDTACSVSTDGAAFCTR